MTDKEAAMIMAILHTAFPAFYRDVTDADATFAANLWAEMFADDPAAEVAAAVKAIIATQIEGFPPTIGAVKEKMRILKNPQRMTAQDAWVCVQKAASGSIRWADLPSPVQRAIGSQAILNEWQMIDSNSFNTVIYSNFVKSFRDYEEKESVTAKLPPSVKRMISDVADSMKMLNEGN